MEKVTLDVPEFVEKIDKNVCAAKIISCNLFKNKVSLLYSAIAIKMIVPKYRAS